MAGNSKHNYLKILSICATAGSPKRAAFWGVIALAAAGLLAVRNGPPQSAKIFVSIGSQKYFVENIAGPDYPVEVLVESGANHEEYEPKPWQLASLKTAAIYFRIGITFEITYVQRLKAQYPSLEVVDLSQGVATIVREGANDPHAWTSPRRARDYAKAILAALLQKFPQSKAGFEERHAKLDQELAQLDAQIAKTLAPYRGKAFLTLHPSYGYFAEDYGLKQLAVEKHGHEPGPNDLTDILADARAAKIKRVFIQPDHSAQAAERVAGLLGADTVMVDPDSPDYVRNLQNFANALASSMQ
jgi:zinc transport system substrate-binding protein